MDDIVKPVIVPMYTPFDSDGALDEKGVGELVRWLIRKGVEAIYVRSGVGGKWLLKVNEVKRLARLSVEAAEGKAKVMVGCEGEWNGASDKRPDPNLYLRQSCDLAAYAERIGADGVFLAMPFPLMSDSGESPTEVSLRYFSAIRRSTSLPILLHQMREVPEEFKLNPDMLEGLSALGGFEGIKVSTDDPSELRRFAEMVRGTDLAFICGNEALWLDALKMGAVSVIGGGCNVYPEIIRAVWERFRAGDEEGARRAQEDVITALRAPGELAGIIWRQYMIRKGVNMKGHDRSGQEPYPQEIVDEFERKVDEILRRY
jgi:4-hydroxy-tetrahydrodipicolinate synthase